MFSRTPNWSRAMLVMALYLGLGAAAVVWASLRGGASVWRLPEPAEARVFSGLALGLIVGLGFVFASRMALHRFEWARDLHREFRSRLLPMTEGEIVILALASSLGEEMFFRGALMPVVGLVPSALLFALLHIGPRRQHWPWTLSSLAAGLLFGAIFAWSGDLTGVVVAHFTVNFLNLRHVAQVEIS